MNTVHPSAQKLADTARNSIQMFQEMAEVVFSASEQIVNLNLEAARSMCAYASSQAAKPVKPDLHMNLAGSAQVQTENFERASTYLRNVSDICLRTQTEMAELGARHFNEVNESMQTLMGEVARMTPLGNGQMFGAAMGTAVVPKQAASRSSAS